MAIVLDSRKIKQGDIFIAIKGTNVDGNDFAINALNNGAKLAIIDKPIGIKDDRLIQVNNTLDAIKRLGKYRLHQTKLEANIGITGSCGKTTTREWLAQILATKYNVCRSMYNYNTIISLPICLDSLKFEDKIGIFELGTNKPGEILELTNYLKPNIGIITNIFESHIGNFKNLQELINEKISLIQGIRPKSFVICNENLQEQVTQICTKCNVKPVFVGFSENCDYCIKEYNSNSVLVQTKCKQIKYKVTRLNKHQCYITAIIITVLDVLKLNLHDFLPHFSNLCPLDGRGKYKNFKYNNKCFTVIDDCYNASPASVKSALEAIKSDIRRKIFVFGQMHELGKYSIDYHKSVIKLAFEIGINKIFLIGDKSLGILCQNILCQDTLCRNSKYQNTKCCTEYYKNINDAIEPILQYIQNDDLILLKGSHSVGLNKFLEVL